MTETTDERPFYEQAQASRVSHPPASRLPVYLICGAAFGAGLIAFFIGGMPDGARTGDFGGSIAYMFGYKLGGQLVYAAIIGGAATAFLSVTDGRKFRQRTAGEDFLWPFLSAIGGGLTMVALIVALAAPAVAANRVARPIQEAHVEAMNQDADGIDREAMAAAGGGVLSGANLSADPGYRKAAAKIETMRAIVAKYRKRQTDRFAATRRQLAAAVSNGSQRKRILAQYDAEVARARPLLDQYWATQDRSVDYMAETLAILKGSPGSWEGPNYYFRRQSDLDRFEAAQASGAELREEAETVRQKLLSLAAAPPTGR